MFTQCPHCSTVFPLPPALLAQGRGMLQCGACGQPFDALDRLAERPEQISPLPPPAEPVLPRIEPPQAPIGVPSIEPGRSILEHATATADVARQMAMQSESSQPPPPATAAGHTASIGPPSFARRHAAAASQGRIGWWAAALLLGALLGGQIVLAQRDELAADPDWRPWLARLCKPLRCTLPAWRDPDQLTLVSRELGPHPSVPNALLVTATIENDAPWPQAWPLLELTLSDLDGEPVALRRFTAAEYLGVPPDSPTLAPGQSALARLEIADPGNRAVAFTFDFR